MALNNTTADALAAQIVAANGIDAGEASKVQNITRLIYAALKTDIQITIAATSIVTNGSATTQSGPPTPINLNPN